MIHVSRSSFAFALAMAFAASACTADSVNPIPSGTTSSSSTGAGAGGSTTLPLSTPEKEWTWVDFPESRCIDDSHTGIAIDRTSDSEDVFLYFEGGGACFNLATCATAANTKGYGADRFAMEKAEVSAMPIMQRTDGALLAKMSHVFIPYCSGDLHGGDNDIEVAGKLRHFHGHSNVAAYLTRIVATFPKAKHVVVAGSSAGGFGALLNYDQIARAFGAKVDVALIDDSGPVFTDQYLPVCLQKHLMTTFGLNRTLPSGCTDCSPASGAFATPTMRYLLTTYADQRLSVVSSTADETIRSFLSFAHDDCVDLMGAPTDYPPALYAAALKNLRDTTLGGNRGFELFQIDGTNGTDPTHHVWLTGDLHEVASHDVRLSDWLSAQLSRDPSWVHVPLN